MKRLEKIRLIKEKLQDNKTVTVRLNPSRLTTKLDKEQQSVPGDAPESPQAPPSIEQARGDAQARVQADDVPAPGDASQRECCPPPPPSDAMAQEKQALGDAQASVQADDVPAPGDAS